MLYRGAVWVCPVSFGASAPLFFFTGYGFIILSSMDYILSMYTFPNLIRHKIKRGQKAEFTNSILDQIWN